jgi:hypothetical protein
MTNGANIHKILRVRHLHFGGITGVPVSVAPNGKGIKTGNHLSQHQKITLEDL